MTNTTNITATITTQSTINQNATIQLMVAATFHRKDPIDKAGQWQKWKPLTLFIYGLQAIKKCNVVTCSISPRTKQ